MVDLSELNPAQRIQYLERSIIFLKQQHAEVLRSLHEEIEGLKKENKGKLHSTTKDPVTGKYFFLFLCKKTYHVGTH